MWQIQIGVGVWSAEIHSLSHEDATQPDVLSPPHPRLAQRPPLRLCSLKSLSFWKWC